MNILKRLFGGSQSVPSTNPGARTRFAAYRQRFSDRSLSDLQRLALDIIEPTTQFAMRGANPISQLERFTSDACLFELACYTIAACDYWLFRRSSPKRAEIMGALSNFTQEDYVFTFRLSHEAISALMNERISEYGKLFARGAEPQGLHLRLSQVLLASSKVPVPQIGAMSEVTFGDPISGQHLAQAQLDWDMGNLETVFTILKRETGLT